MRILDVLVFGICILIFFDDPRDPRIVHVLDEIGANDSNRNYVAKTLLPVDEPFIQQYVTNTTSPLHKYKLKVVACFKIDSPRDREFKNLMQNHKLLWHGTTVESVYPILYDGYRHPVSSENGMFGQGIYFSDCVTKACNYTNESTSKLLGAGDIGDTEPGFIETGYLFLSEVALGRCTEYTEANHNAKALLNSSDSVFARGSLRPDGEYVMRDTEPKIFIPMGPLKHFEDLDLKHNEYAVYCSTQIRHRYLVKVQIV